MGNDLDIILAATGPLFQAAVGLEALALLADTAGNQRGGETDEHSPRWPLNSLLLGVASLITPGVLMIYAWFSIDAGDVEPMGREFQIRVGAVAIIIAAMIAGSILGWGVGRMGWARVMRLLALPLALAACALAIFVGWPTIQGLVTALSEGRAILVAPPALAPAH